MAAILTLFCTNTAIADPNGNIILQNVILSTVQPWRLPSLHTTLAWCVWTAHWLVILSLWLIANAPRYRIDFLHVLFIGGFTLLILAVGTRVTLSHGGHSLALERGSWPLRIGLITGLIAMLARVGAPFAAMSYFEHLALAAWDSPYGSRYFLARVRR